MKYLLSEANQNTFVLFDCLQEGIQDSHFLTKVHQTLVMEQRDDALILTRSGAWDAGGSPLLKMQVFGLDGTFGEFCGNGALSCAAYLFDQYAGFETFFLNTTAGKVPLWRSAYQKYAVELPKASQQLNTKFIRKALPGFNYVEILEPHLLIEGDLSDEELLTLGRDLNARSDIFPNGINLNAWYPLEENLLSVKTYERGVQRLTQSCGSGSACCAAFYRPRGEIQVKTPGGTLELAMDKKRILLKGQASYCHI